MPQYTTTRGLVLRSADYKESSRMLTLLTEAEGKISASAKGVRRKNSRLAAAAQPYAWAEFTLSQTAGRWTVTEANALELFPGVAADLERFALAAYLAELLETVCRDGLPEPELLRLGLNSFFTLSEGKKEPALVKAAFELRLLCLAGYAPQMDRCSVCGKETPAEPVFALDGGGLTCRACAAEREIPAARLCRDSLAAERYIESAEDRRLFSFALGGPALGRLARANERYLLTMLEREPRSLGYYKQIAETIHNA